MVLLLLVGGSGFFGVVGTAFCARVEVDFLSARNNNVTQTKPLCVVKIS